MMWMIVLGIINLILLVLGLIFFFPKEAYKIKIGRLFLNIKDQLIYILIIFAIVAFHLLEVNFIDATVTEWVGYDYANTIKSMEGDVVYWFSQNWTQSLVYFFVFMYIGVYPFTLWFAPLYFIVMDKKRSMKNLAYGLLIIYIIALPFYLFLPITNVYTYYSNAGSALESVIPAVENFFYTTTTQNNCLPSLHTAMTILIAWTAHLTGNKKFTYFTYFCMISVIISVIYLSIHWITDVIAGVLLAIGAIFILNRYIKE